MKFRVLKLFIFVLVLCSSTSAKRYSGGGSSRSSSSGSRTSFGGFGRSKPSYTSVSRPSSSVPSSHTVGRTSSSDFLHAESGRPSAPKPSHNTQSSPSTYHAPDTHSSIGTSYKPSAPYPTNSGKPSVVHEQHQQSSASSSHADPYAKQPAYNPSYTPSGGYGKPGGLPPPPAGVSVPSYANTHSSASGNHHVNSPPYPLNPSHPLPSNVPTSNFPSHTPISPQTHHNTYNAPPPYNSAPTYNSAPHYNAPPPYNSAPHYNAPPPYNPYQGAPPSYGSYHPSASGHPPPAYHPPTAPFQPSHTVVVVPDSHRSSSGPGIGSYIAGGVAAGASNAIVDHVISGIFRGSSSNHVHTYPSAPPVATPSSTVTNNYYYGGAGPTDNGNAVAGQPAGQPAAQPAAGQPAAQPAAGQPAAQPAAGQPAAGGPTQMENPSPGVNVPASGGTQANPGITTGVGDPATASNGAVSKIPEGQAPATGFISDEDLMQFTEELFDKQDVNLNQYVELNLQKRASTNNNDGTVPDEAPEPLFNLKPELNSIPTVVALKALYDNFQRDATQNETITDTRRNEENTFLDEIAKTPVMSRALNWLVEKKYVEPDGYEQKEVLKRMWFKNYDHRSSGFERVFLSEKTSDAVFGMQNWIYFAHLESKKDVNYLSYVEMTSLSGKGSLLKLNYETAGFTIQNATIFVGTPPELELALYTVCSYARPNYWCPISLGGAKFFIMTRSFRYYDNDLIDIAFPTF